MTPQEEIDTEEIVFTKQELNFACELGRKEIEKLQSQLSTALSEALALRVEVERLRKTLTDIAECGCEGEEYDICREEESDISEYCYPCQANEALPPNAQPTPTGLTDNLLRLVVAVYKWCKLDPTPLEARCRLERAAEALTPDEVKIIEGFR